MHRQPGQSTEQGRPDGCAQRHSMKQDQRPGRRHVTTPALAGPVPAKVEEKRSSTSVADPRRTTGLQQRGCDARESPGPKLAAHDRRPALKRCAAWPARLRRSLWAGRRRLRRWPATLGPVRCSSRLKPARAELSTARPRRSVGAPQANASLFWSAGSGPRAGSLPCAPAILRSPGRGTAVCIVCLVT